MFVVGGLGKNGSPLASIEVYTPSNNSWTTFAQLPSARSEVGCAASGNNLIVAGGDLLLFAPQCLPACRPEVVHPTYIA